MNAPKREPSERVLGLLALYRRTQYGIVMPAGGASTLAVGVTTPSVVRDWIGDGRVAMYLTACNPYSRPTSVAENAERLMQLRDRLREAGARFLEGEAGIPGEPWREASVLATDVPIDRLDRLAAQFEQNASLFVPRAGLVHLRIYRRDWCEHVDVDAVADIEWVNC